MWKSSVILRRNLKSDKACLPKQIKKLGNINQPSTYTSIIIIKVFGRVNQQSNEFLKDK